MSQEKRPFFSVVVPTYDRPGELVACLQSLAAADYPRGRLEVVVVDDGGTVPLEEIVAGFTEVLNIELIRQPNRGPAAARNAGAARARGDFLVLIDDDCAAATSWFKVCERQLARKPDHAIGGRTINGLEDNLFAVTSQLLIDYLYAYFNTDSERATFLTSNNLAVSADRFRRLSGFDPRFTRVGGEDREFCDRWLAERYGLLYSPKMIVYHRHRMTLASFWRQHMGYGRGAFHYRMARAERRWDPLRIEPMRFYTGLLLFPLSRRPGKWKWSVMLLLVASQVANAIGFFAEYVRHKQRGSVTQER